MLLVRGIVSPVGKSSRYSAPVAQLDRATGFERPAICLPSFLHSQSFDFKQVSSPVFACASLQESCAISCVNPLRQRKITKQIESSICYTLLMMDYREIQIGEYTVLVDTADFDEIVKHKWSIYPRKGAYYYPEAFINNKQIFLHRYLLDCPKNLVVDHINGNTLDNRRTNLRIVSHEYNCFNLHRNTRNTSGHRGISYVQKENRWKVKCRFNKTDYYIGRYKTLEEAIEARNYAYQDILGGFTIGAYHGTCLH